MELFISLFSIVICPINEFSFFVSVINKLYFVKVKDKKCQPLLKKCFDEKTSAQFHKALEKLDNCQYLKNKIFSA